MKKSYPTASSADVMLLLEGTFPFIRGGVSGWVDQLIRSFPHLTFACVFIGSREKDYGEIAYVLPDNVVHLETHFLYENQPGPDLVRQNGHEGNAETFKRIATLHDTLKKQGNDGAGVDIATLRHSMDLFDENSGVAISEQDFLYSRRSWDYITEQYRKFCTDPSFTDYFWTVRIMHQPLWQLLQISRTAPRARVLHTVSTGYAGFLGALLHHRTGRPLITSEHGIYTKERKIDLFQNEWIHDNRRMFEKDISQVSYFRTLWIRFFETMGRVCYDASHDVIALFEGNRVRQVKDGAPVEKTCTIPNGIPVEKYVPLRADIDQKILEAGPEGELPLPPPVLCLIGRVVPIKDIKTFIRSMLSVIRTNPDAVGWIVGPEEEDPEYAIECRELVNSLGLSEAVLFKGYRNVSELLPQCGLVILSSISEALPLVVLESFAAGVPVVSTDVGACRELVFGMAGNAEDEALGAAGDIVRIADPTALARASLGLLTSPQKWHAARRAAIARVERYYTLGGMVADYDHLYQQAMKLPDAKATSSPAAGCPMHKQQGSTQTRSE